MLGLPSIACWPHREKGELAHVGGERALVLVLDREGLHLETDDARARERVLAVKLDDEAQVVVDVRRARDGARALRRPNEAHRVAAVVPVRGEG
eukprot:3343116-Prymnesium_polylepis.2